MLFRLLSKLQRKPESYRKRFTIVFSASLTVIIFLVWFSVTISRITSPQENVATAVDAKPLNVLSDNFNQLTQSLSNSIEKLKESFGDISFENASTTLPLEESTSTLLEVPESTTTEGDKSATSSQNNPI